MGSTGFDERINPLQVREEQQRMDFWRLCDELSVLQAAALLIDVDPMPFTGCRRGPPDRAMASAGPRADN